MSTRVPMRGTGTEQAVVVEKDRNGSGAKGLPHRAGVGAAIAGGNTDVRTVQVTVKPLPISKRQVWEVYRQVKANGGAAGIDGQTVEAFERAWQTTSTSSGTGWPRAATCRQRSSGAISPQGWRRDAAARCTHRGGPHSADSDQAGAGSHRGTIVPRILLWLQAGEIGTSGTGTDAPSQTGARPAAD